VRPLRYVQGTPDGAEHRIFGPVAAFYLKQILRGVALPDGWAMGQGINRARQVGFKTGTSYGYRDAWAVGFSNDYTVGVWVGRADGSPRAGHVGRESAAPILLKAFELLPPDMHGDEAPPSGALLTTVNDQLPPSMRVFRRESAPAPPKETTVPPPTIAFPPNGTVVPLPPDSAKDHTIVLKADGGKEPLTWLVNGQLIGNFDRLHPVLYTPDGEGLARITVVDSAGRSDTSQVRFKKAKS
jgi:penicillin-binding protein 1C